MSAYKLVVNGRERTAEVEESTPLLWALRDALGMVDTKFGCGKGLCGACTVLVNGTALRSCQLPIQGAVGMEITTIEGIAEDADHPVQKAWIAENVPQCGYCQGGQVLSAIAMLKDNANPSDSEIDSAMGGNLCRCGTYPRIKKAIKRVVKEGGLS